MKLSTDQQLADDTIVERTLNSSQSYYSLFGMETVKRFEDIVIATLLLIIIAPALLLLVILIKLDSRGPIFFWQQRVGRLGNAIWVCKFRSMYPSFGDEFGKHQTKPGDPRITPIGRILRKHSLDELPQLFNVLRGDMSLVGPRPHAILTRIDGHPVETLAEFYRHRYSVKPGITGWAQVNGWRGEMDTVEKLVRRLEHDLHYIDNWSLALDIKILVRTVGCAFKDEHAF